MALNPQNIEKHKFKKGQSGNPKGRPKLPDIREAMAKILSDEKDGKTALDAILAALRAKATKGDVRAAQELLDRAFGKSQQKIDHTTKGDKITMPDYSKLTDEEIQYLAELQRKAGTY